MATFNTKKKAEQKLRTRPMATTNHEGALAFNLSPHLKLYLMAASRMVGEEKFYEKGYEADVALVAEIEKMCKSDPEFVLQCAKYIRDIHYNRDTPLMMAGVYANCPDAFENHRNKVPLARQYVKDIIQRADAMPNLIAFQLNQKGRKTKLPMMIKNGIAEAFEKFDAYSLKKNDHHGREVSMRDVMRLCRPKPRNAERAETYRALAKGELATPMTWEAMRSADPKTWTWHKILNEIFHADGKTKNYMALLRNQRNILEDPSVTREDILLDCEMLRDKSAVLKSKQFPFRFLSAYKILMGYHVEYNLFTGPQIRLGRPIAHPMLSSVLDALEDAIDYSIENIPKFKGITVIAGDVSGSMRKPISKHSTIENFDIAMLLSMIANKCCENAITGVFGDTWSVTNAPKRGGILRNTLDAYGIGNCVGFSTNGHEVINYLNREDIEADRILMFTDNQMWDSSGRRAELGGAGRRADEQTLAGSFIKYQHRNPNCKLYSFDLAGYGTCSFPEDQRGVAIFGGWSEKNLEFIEIFENTLSEGEGVVERIKKIKPNCVASAKAEA